MESRIYTRPCLSSVYIYYSIFFLLQNNNPSNKLMYVNTILQLINVQTTKT